MTYLQLINHVMRRLREDEVATYNETDYSTLIGDLVNDAMLKVQNAWNWSMLQTTTTVNTVASTATVELADSNEHTQIHQIVNTTNNHRLTSQARSYIDYQQAMNNSEGPPTYWSFSSQDSADGDATIQLWPTPDAVYALEVLHNVKQDRMTDSGDVLLVPDDPVIQLAVAYALEERGDTGGQNNMTQFQRADQALADAVALDMNRDPDLSTWTEY